MAAIAWLLSFSEFFTEPNFIRMSCVTPRQQLECAADSRIDRGYRCEIESSVLNTIKPRHPEMNPIVLTVLLLTASNVFMTFAWYGHLKNLGSRPLIVA